MTARGGSRWTEEQVRRFTRAVFEAPSEARNNERDDELVKRVARAISQPSNLAGPNDVDKARRAIAAVRAADRGKPG